MRYGEFLSQISFRFVEPRSAVDEHGWFQLDRNDGPCARLLSLPGVPLDLINTSLPCNERDVKKRLRQLTQIPRMSTFAISTLIQLAVRTIPKDSVFLNIGLWHGFTFLSGVVGHPEKTCIGVDNFSQFGGPREAFAERFEKLKSVNHRYYDLDYRDYFSRMHRDPIGVYIYDGDHSYDNQLLGLQIAEPFFTDGCIILVDDTNWPGPRQAIRDFIAGSRFGYRVLLDETTRLHSGRLTYWNGVTVIQKTGERTAPKLRDTPGLSASSPQSTAPPDECEDPLVSLIICNHNGGTALRSLIDTAVSQSHPNVEVLVVDEGPEEQLRDTIRPYDDRITPVILHGETQAEALRVALDRSRGNYVAFMEAADVLTKASVAEALESGNKRAEWAARECATARDLAEIVSTGETFILVDEEQLNRQVAAGRKTLPFLERNGVYWGRPADDATAVRELERLRNRGARFIAFCWPTFWWLEHYADFATYLSSHYRCVRRNERLIVYELSEH